MSLIVPTLGFVLLGVGLSAYNLHKLAVLDHEEDLHETLALSKECTPFTTRKSRGGYTVLRKGVVHWEIRSESRLGGLRGRFWRVTRGGVERARLWDLAEATVIEFMEDGGTEETSTTSLRLNTGPFPLVVAKPLIPLRVFAETPIPQREATGIDRVEIVQRGDGQASFGLGGPDRYHWRKGLSCLERVVDAGAGYNEVRQRVASICGRRERGKKEKGMTLWIDEEAIDPLVVLLSVICTRWLDPQRLWFQSHRPRTFKPPSHRLRSHQRTRWLPLRAQAIGGVFHQKVESIRAAWLWKRVTREGRG